MKGLYVFPGMPTRKNTEWLNQRGLAELDILKTWWEAQSTVRTREESQGMWSCLLPSHWNCLGQFAHLPIPQGCGEVVCKTVLEQMLGLAIIYWFMMSTWINASKTGLGNVMLRRVGCVLWAMEGRGVGATDFKQRRCDSIWIKKITGGSEFQAWLHRLWSLWPWVNHLISQRFNFLICKKRVVVPTLRIVVRKKWNI